VDGVFLYALLFGVFSALRSGYSGGFGELGLELDDVVDLEAPRPHISQGLYLNIRTLFFLTFQF